MLYHQVSTCFHALVPSHQYFLKYHSVLFYSMSLCRCTHTILSPLSFLPSLPFFLPFVIVVFCLSSPILLMPPSFPSFPPYSVPLFPLRCTHLCDRLLLTHSTSAALQMRAGRAKRRAWCGAQRTGFNEASLNEFTAFHWTALSHVADKHLSHCVKGPLSVLLPVCLTPL